MAALPSSWPPCPRHGRLVSVMAGLPSSWPLCFRHGRLDRPSLTGHLLPGRDAVPSLSRRKRGRPGRWTSQLLLLRPRPSAWPVTSSNMLRPAASGVTAPSPGPRALPFPPIRSGISAPPPSWPPSRRLSDRKTSWPAPTGHLSPCCRHGRLDRPSLPPSHHFCSFLLA